MRNVFWSIGIVAALFIVDAATKAWVVASIPENNVVFAVTAYRMDASTLFPRTTGHWNLMCLTHVQNHGAPFGLYQPEEPGQTTGFWMFRILVSAVCAAGLIRYWKTITANRVHHTLALLTVAGSIGNILDSFLYGYVVDWLYVAPFPWVVNLADVYIFSALPVLIWMSFRESAPADTGSATDAGNAILINQTAPDEDPLKRAA